MTESQASSLTLTPHVANKSENESAPPSPSLPTFPQLQSSFFSSLPLEIRQNIYRHLWEASGSTQHVYKATPSALAPLSHCACVSDPNAEDIREIELTRILAAPSTEQTPVDGAVTEEAEATQEATALRDEINDWRLRNASFWCNHWECEEEPPVLRRLDDAIGDKDAETKKPTPVMVKEFSPFLAILLTCKRMHQEAVDSIYDNTTFSFIGTDSLSRFLETTAAESLARINTVHLIWSAPIESYMDPDDEEAIAAKISWIQLWMDVAIKLPRMKELRIWMYPQYCRYPMPYEEWFRPLHQFGHVPKFDICLRWFMDPSRPETDTGPLDFLEEAPFEYVRVPPLPENPLHLHWRRLIGLYLDEPRTMPTRRQRSRRYVGRS